MPPGRAIAVGPEVSWPPSEDQPDQDEPFQAPRPQGAVAAADEEAHVADALGGDGGVVVDHRGARGGGADQGGDARQHRQKSPLHRQRSGMASAGPADAGRYWRANPVTKRGL